MNLAPMTAPPPDRPPEKTADLLEWSQRQLVTTRCRICGESIEAPASEARVWFAQHRRKQHPNLAEPVARRPGRRPSESRRP
jgi:hypothetical protein